MSVTTDATAIRPFHAESSDEALTRYWGSEYDFGRVEARLNAFPQFMTEIDGHTNQGATYVRYV